MSKEIIEASLLRLRSSVLETFEALKDALEAPAEDGSVDKIANLSNRLAQLEGGLLTLQQYAPLLEEQVKSRMVERTAAALSLLQQEEAQPPPPAAPLTEVTEEELKDKSPTFRKSQTGKPRGRRKKKDESKK